MAVQMRDVPTNPPSFDILDGDQAHTDRSPVAPAGYNQLSVSELTAIQLQFLRGQNIGEFKGIMV